MEAILDSVNNVTNFMDEIAVASDARRKGIEQVQSAVVQMDGVTQQNASLVEENSEAAISLAEQAAVLNQSVLVSRLRERGTDGQEQSVFKNFWPLFLHKKCTYLKEKLVTGNIFNPEPERSGRSSEHFSRY